MLTRRGQAAWRHSGRVLRGLVVALMGGVMLLTLAGGGLAWRLSGGPVRLDWLARRIEAQLDRGPIRVRIGALRMAWDGWRHGPGLPILFEIHDLRVVRGVSEVAAVERASVSIAFSPLLIGRIAPRSVLLDGGHLRLVRGADGALRPDTGPMTDAQMRGLDAPPLPVAQLWRDLGRPAGSARMPVPGTPFRLGEVRRLVVRDLAMTVRDRQLGTAWQVRDLWLDLVRHAVGGLDGHGAARSLLGAAPGDAPGTVDAAVAWRVSLDRHAATTVQVHVAPITPAALGNALPAMGLLRAADLPIGGDLTASLRPDFGLVHASVRLHAGAGTARYHEIALPVQSADLWAEGDPAHLDLHELRVQIAPGGRPTIATLSGRATRAARFEAALALTFDRIAFADLKNIWPVGLGGGARPWLTENVTAGIAHDARFQAVIQAGPDLSAPKIVSAGGHVAGDGLVVHWLRPVPPATDGHGVLTLLSPDVAEIAVSSARQGDLQLRDGTMRITGLQVRDQDSVLHGVVDGEVADMIALLRQPRLHLLAGRPIRLDDPAGTVRATLNVLLPLETNVTIQQIGIAVQAQVDDLHLTGLALDKNIDRGDLDLHITNAGLHLTGNADFAGVPSDVGVELDFRDGPPDQVTQRIVLRNRPTDRQLAAAGYDPHGVVTGPSAVTTEYRAHRDGVAMATVRADLSASRLAVPQLGWAKPPGEPARMRAHIAIRDGKVTAVDAMRVEAPTLLVRGHADYEDGHPAVLCFDQIDIGHSRAAGTLSLPTQPGAPIDIVIAGSRLDLPGNLLSAQSNAPPDAAPGVPWRLAGRFDQVGLAEGRVVPDVSVQAEHDGRMIHRARLQTAGPAALRLQLDPDGSGRHLTGHAADAGLLLHLFGVLPQLHGGQIGIDARFDDARPDHPLVGTGEMQDFTIDAPAIVRVVQGVSIYGLPAAARGEGVRITKLTAPFRMAGSMVTLQDTRAYDAALGVTAQGWIDLARGTAALDGTVVPVYALNALLGRLPMVGRLFSPERGGGLFAARYVLRGRLSDPTISMNPLSVLAPGALRGVFDVFR